MEERGELRQLRLQKMVNYLIGSGCARNHKYVAERLNITHPSLMQPSNRSRTHRLFIFTG